MATSCLIRVTVFGLGLGVSCLLAPAALAQKATARPTSKPAAPIVAKPVSMRARDSVFTPQTPRDGTLARPYEYTEQMPEFPGGDAALRELLAKQVVYPEVARQNKVEGRVFLKFIVDEKGQVQNPVVLKGLGSGLDEEAVRVAKLLPRFTKPARQNGQPVCVYYSVPVTFSLK